MKKDNYWRDQSASPHGPWCQEKFFPLICKYCHKEVYYFECSHGCKVYFHKIPSRDGEWDSKCPNYRQEKHDDNYEFNYDLSNNNDYEFNYDLSNNNDYEFNYDLSNNDHYNFSYDLDKDENEKS